jgi:hypothetical protein
MAAKSMELETKITAAGADQSGIAHAAPASHNGTYRLDAEAVNVSPLTEPITFEFSGRTAKNRFLKAPMTERLCHWNKEGEDIVLQILTSRPGSTGS